MIDTTKRGFSLVEISIVLVIISLVIAGVIGGRSLIDNSKLQQVISDVNNFKIAVQQYENRFGYLPGDDPNAYNYFDGSGGSAICGPSSGNWTSCNGTGDGRWAYSYGGETLLAWAHLSLAKMINSPPVANNRIQPTTNGHNHDGNTIITGEQNIPISPFGGTTGYTFVDMTSAPAGHTVYGRSGRSIWLGAETMGTNGYHDGPVLSPVQAHTIDKKDT